MSKLKNIKNQKNILEGKYWLLMGTLSYLSILIYSLSKSLEKSSFLINFYISLDWIAASIIYFFIGAAIGFIIDLILSNNSKKAIKFPLWLLLTLIIWFLGSLTSLIITSDNINLLIILFYPVIYGIFFIGAAYVVIFPDIIKEMYLSKLFFDIFIIFLFSFWIKAVLNVKKSKKHISESALTILFAILLIGSIYSAIYFFLT